jgi:hypothetical protein
MPRPDIYHEYEDFSDYYSPNPTPEEIAREIAEADEDLLVEIKKAKYARPAEARTEYTPEELLAGSKLLSRVTGIDDVKVVPDVIIPGLLMGMGRTMIYAEPGSGKSAFSYRLADAVAHGDPFLGHKTVPRPVLYLDRENPTLVLQEWKGWLKIRDRCKADPNSNLLVFGLHGEYEPPALNVKEVIDWALIQNPKPLIIVDTFIRFQEGDEEENNGHHIKKFWERTERLYKMGCAILILHHTPKGRSDIFRGHTDIMGKLDLAFHLHGRHTGPKLTGMKLVRSKDRLGQAAFAQPTEILISSEGEFTLKPEDEKKKKPKPAPYDQGAKLQPYEPGTETALHLEELYKLLEANPGMTKSTFERLAVARGIPQAFARTFSCDEEIVNIEVEGRKHYISLK